MAEAERRLGSKPPIIIIGAGRSGTKLLRDILCALPGLGTWPCDEINYIWRHGNASVPHDELTRGDARPEVVTYVRRTFKRLVTRRGIEVVVEKTCANSLRVGFVDEILPEARFIHLIRDGRDVAASARRRWSAPLDLTYALRKARYIPVSDLPYYAARHAWNRLQRYITSDGRIGSWGPRFRGMDQALEDRPLIEVCALQWRRCVESAISDLERLDSGRVTTLRYETFVTSPLEEVRRLARFLAVDLASVDPESLVEPVTSEYVGSWRRALNPSEAERVEELLAGPLERLGYRDVSRA